MQAQLVCSRAESIVLYKSHHHHHHQHHHHHHHQTTATCLCFSSMRPLLNTCANVLVPVLILQDLLMSILEQQVLHVRLSTDMPRTLICMSLDRSSQSNMPVFGQKSVTTRLCFGQRVTATWLCWEKGHDVMPVLGQKVTASWLFLVSYYIMPVFQQHALIAYNSRYVVDWSQSTVQPPN